MRDELKRRVDAIESGYELMLAFAAQGLPSDRQSSGGGQLRQFLQNFHDALPGLAEMYGELVAEAQPGHAGDYADFLEVLARDAKAAQAGLRIVLAQPDISSQLVDNLNASIHVRALLTDIFLIDELLK